MNIAIIAHNAQTRCMKQIPILIRSGASIFMFCYCGCCCSVLFCQACQKLFNSISSNSLAKVTVVSFRLLVCLDFEKKILQHFLEIY